MSNYWLFNVNYQKRPDVWRKCKEHGFVAMHYHEDEDNLSLINRNLDRIKLIRKGDFIIAYSAHKSFLGLGKAVGEFYEETDSGRFYDIEYHQRVNVEWMIAEDKPVVFMGKGFKKTLGITGNMSFNVLFPIQREAYDYVHDLMKQNLEWTKDENEIIIADYFEMLTKEIMNEPIDKAVHKIALKERLAIQNDSSIDLKYRSISAILDKNNFPYLSFYMPQGKYQSDLEEMVLLHNVKAIMLGNCKMHEIVVTAENYHEFLADVPNLKKSNGRRVNQNRKGKVDVNKNALENKRIGDAGEKLVMNIERIKLIEAGKENLAEKIEHVAKENDFAGYDIKSFSEDGKVIFIEVKTTNGNSYQPFFLSASEYRKAQECPDNYFIYRIYNFTKKPKFFILSVKELDELNIEVVNYRVSLGEEE